MLLVFYETIRALAHRAGVTFKPGAVSDVAPEQFRPQPKKRQCWSCCGWRCILITLAVIIVCVAAVVVGLKFGLSHNKAKCTTTLQCPNRPDIVLLDASGEKRDSLTCPGSGAWWYKDCSKCVTCDNIQTDRRASINLFECVLPGLKCTPVKED